MSCVSMRVRDTLSGGYVAISNHFNLGKTNQQREKEKKSAKNRHKYACALGGAQACMIIRMGCSPVHYGASSKDIAAASLVLLGVVERLCVHEGLFGKRDACVPWGPGQREIVCEESVCHCRWYIHLVSHVINSAQMGASVSHAHTNRRDTTSFVHLPPW